jgi:C-terminal processing protease CtpA/Prc
MVKVFQEHYWQDSIVAIKLSCKFKNYEDFYVKLIEELPQTSEASRKRIANTILLRFFPEKSLDQPTQLAWKTYRDEQLLQALMRYQFLVSEPVISEFVKRYVLTAQPGDRLEFHELADPFIKELYREAKPNLQSKLSGALQATGLVTRSKQSLYVREQIDMFAPQPTTIDVQDILNHVFWRYLGMRSPTEVIKLLRWLESKKILAKYVRADQLEQVTTIYTSAEILNHRKLP